MGVQEFEDFCKECEDEFRGIMQRNMEKKEMKDFMHKINETCCSDFELNTIVERLLDVMLEETA